MVVRVEHPFFGRRFATAWLFIFTMLSLLVVRLWYLQGMRGAYFRDLSENNRIRTIRTLAARGTIYDREGRVLVGNRPSFLVELILEDTPNVDQTLQELAAITGRTYDELRKQLDSQKGRYHFEPKIVIADASREEVAKVRVHSYRLPGVIVEVVPTRFFPENALGAQMFGYTREITKKQLEDDDTREYKRGDIVGQTGLEKEWEGELRGKNGYRQVEVDAMGQRKGELGSVDDLPGLPGKDLYLSIDLDLQRVAEQAFQGRRGAAVVLDPRNGDVLALVSAPAFDANVFAGQIKLEDWNKVSKDKDQPLHNRAIAEVYPPGSTFKLVTSVAALAEKKLNEHTTLSCPGYYFFAGRRYHCHKRTGHGGVDLKRALTVSCNAFYFQVGQLLGIELIEKYGKLLGLGAPTGIDLPGEVEGIVPSDAWKRKKWGERWYPGDTLPVSIGQGYLVVSPIQMATMVSTIANGGTVYTPRLVQKIVDRNSATENAVLPNKVHDTGIAPEIFAQVRQIATGVVNDPAGTGKAAKIEQVLVGGKTGTAQVGRLGKEHLGEQFKDHAWFVSFAPVDNPEIASAIIVENSGHGGTFAAPIAKQIYETYFRKKGVIPPPEPLVVVDKAQSMSTEEPVESEETADTPEELVGD